MRNTAVFVPLGLFAAFAVMLGLGLRNDPTRIPSVLIDRPMPQFALTPLKPGSEGFARSDLGNGVALVNVFASWCVVCSEEHPTLMRLARDSAVPIYGIDWKDAPKDGAEWLERNGDPYRKTGSDENGRLAIDLGVSGAPETFVVDGKGRIRFKQIGAITPEDWRQTLAPLIAKLDAETGDAR